MKLSGVASRIKDGNIVPLVYLMLGSTGKRAKAIDDGRLLQG
jgi:hypothetical protein